MDKEARAMERIEAFWRGAVEFRAMVTTCYESDAASVAYDWGRELAHRTTLRHFERELSARHFAPSDSRQGP